MTSVFTRFSLAIFILSLSCMVLSQNDPGIDWKVQETPHFKVIFDASQKGIAERYALYAEVAYADLAPIFREMPKKSTIVISNKTDVSNGFALGFPYPHSIVFPVIPPSQQSVGEYGHWGQELITHEFTHLLQFEPKHGIMGFLEKIFGTVIAPNGLMPRWWLEGLAVETESQLSNGGRMRSLRQQATLRALVLGDHLKRENIARVNETSIPDWLGGSRPYLFGSLIWNEIVETNNVKSIHTLNQAYSSRMPYIGLNTPIQDISGQRYQKILKTVYAKIGTNAKEQIQKIESAGVVPVNNLIIEDAVSYRPSISPDAQVLGYVEKHIDYGSRLMIKKRTNERSFLEIKPEVHGSVAPFTRFSWKPDSKSLIFDQLGTHDRYYNFSDLYSYNIQDQELKQLTFGLRAREPGVSLDGKSIAFVKVLGDEIQLAVVDIDGKKLEILHSPKPGFRISHPEYISENQLVFTLRDLNGNEQLHLYDFDKKDIEKILPEFNPAYRPRQTKRGLVFSSGVTGAFNAYLADEKLVSAKAISNTRTGIDYVDWDSATDELIVTEITPFGSGLGFQKGTEQAFPPQIGLTVPYNREKYQPPSIGFRTEEKDYSPGYYLLPRHWMPYVLLSEGGLFLQASTSASDPVGRHSYSLLGAYDTGTEQLNASASYRNATTRIPITLSGYQLFDFFGGSSFLRKYTAASLSGAGYFYGLDNKWRWTAGWNYVTTEVGNINTRQQGPSVSARYVNVSKRGKQVAPESGGDVLFTFTNYIESLGTVGFLSTKLNGSYNYSPSWFARHHVLSAKLRSVYSPENDNFFNGESTAGGTFSTTLVSSQLLMRGYLTGNFIAQSAINPSLEYIFPLKYIYRGQGLAPFFSKNLSGRLIADFITLDGAFFDQTSNVFRATKLGTFYTGVGAEVHWSTTLGYHLPFQFFVGLYYGANSEASGGFQSFFGFTL